MVAWGGYFFLLLQQFNIICMILHISIPKDKTSVILISQRPLSGSQDWPPTVQVRSNIYFTIKNTVCQLFYYYVVYYVVYYNNKIPCKNLQGINFLMIVFSLPLMAVSANRTYNHTKHSERYCSPLLLYIKDTNMSIIYKISRCGMYRSGL